MRISILTLTMTLAATAAFGATAPDAPAPKTPAKASAITVGKPPASGPTVVVGHQSATTQVSQDAQAAPARTTADANVPADWGATIAMIETYALSVSGIGVTQGPCDTPPGNSAGNGITTNGQVLGLNASGNTIVAKNGCSGQ